MNNHSSLEQEVSAGNAWTRFWFTPIPTTGLHCLRVLSGLLFLFWLLSFVGHQTEFFSLAGWIDEKAYLDMQRPGNVAPAPIGWSILYLTGDDVAMFQAMYWGSIFVFVLFTLGIATRITGIMTWVIVVSFLANPAISYEGDYLLAILAFYLMIGYSLTGQWRGLYGPIVDLLLAAQGGRALFSLAFSWLPIKIPGAAGWVERNLGSPDDFVFSPWMSPRRDTGRPTSYSANLIVRMFQIHFAIIIVTSGLHKLQIAEWWSGVALWFPLHPTFKTSLESLQREAPNADSTLFFLSLAQYVVLAWQLTLPFYAWRSARIWRSVLLGGAAIGWLGTMFLFQLPSFGPFVMIGCLSFLRPEEWSSILRRIRPDELKAAVAGTRSDGDSAESKKVAVASRKDTNIKK